MDADAQSRFASALLVDVAQFLGLCVARLRDAQRSDVLAALEAGERLRFVVEADDCDIKAARVELLSGDGVAVGITEVELSLTYPGAGRG